MKFLQWWQHNFTMHRWALNPFQMYDISFLVMVAIAQIQLGVQPISVLAELDRQTTLYLAAANVVGGSIALLGLHLRFLEEALWVELCGYLVLVFVLGTYLVLVVQGQANPNAGYGFGLSEAFVYAAIHRGVQILLYKRARRKRTKLGQEVQLLQASLGINPSASVMGEEDTE